MFFIPIILISICFSINNEDVFFKNKVNIDCPGNIGCPCENNNDCLNNYCIKIPKGGFCQPTQGDSLPDFYSFNQFEELININDLDLKGKYVLLEMGTTWCAPCNVLASWLAWDDKEIYSKKWWKPEYKKIKYLIENDKVLLITILYEDENRNNATYDTVYEWYDNFPDEHTLVISDDNKDLHKLLKPTGIPAISLLDSNMKVIKYANRGLNAAFDKLIELTNEK